jgi:hypothetical protein
LFDIEISGKSLFILEKEAEIDTLYRQILEKEKIPAGGARNKAVKRLWTQADQEEWATKAEVITNDIPKFVADFLFASCD